MNFVIMEEHSEILSEFSSFQMGSDSLYYYISYSRNKIIVYNCGFY